MGAEPWGKGACLLGLFVELRVLAHTSRRLGPRVCLQEFEDFFADYRTPDAWRTPPVQTLHEDAER